MLFCIGMHDRHYFLPGTRSLRVLHMEPGDESWHCTIRLDNYSDSRMYWLGQALQPGISTRRRGYTLYLQAAGEGLQADHKLRHHHRYHERGPQLYSHQALRPQQEFDIYVECYSSLYVQ